MWMKIVCLICIVLSVANIVFFGVKYFVNRKKIQNGKYIVVYPKITVVLFFVGIVLYQGAIVVSLFFDLYRALILETLLVFFLLEFGAKSFVLVSDDGVMIKWKYISKQQLSESSIIRRERKNSYYIQIRNEHLYENLLIDKKKMFFQLRSN